MTHGSKKFNNVRATRLTLLLAISLTTGIGTAVYSSLPAAQSTSQLRQAATSTNADPSNQDQNFGASDQQAWSMPQAVPNTRSPIMTTTRPS